MVRRNIRQIKNKMRLVAQMLLFIGLVTVMVLAQANANEYERMYKKHCGTCHGNTGNGKGIAGASLTSKPTDFTSDESHQRLTTEKIKKGIKNGVVGTSMVAYARLFDEKTLDGLTAYIENSFMGKRDKVTTSVDAPKKITGRLLYIEHCSACHGDQGESAVWAKNGLNPPPRNFTTAKSKDELSTERMITSVTHGRPGTAMMSFKKRLTEKQIISVVGFIRENFMQKNEASLESPHSQKTPMFVTEKPHEKTNMQAIFANELTGNASSGKVFYESNCFTCHGKKGDGKGPRSHFNYPRPRNFKSDESRLIFNRPRLFKAISLGKRGSVMPTWKTVLSDQQIADVAEFVFQQFILGMPIEVEKKKSFVHK